MSVSETEVARVASLARIAVPPERLAGLAGELSGILDWIEQLAEVDVEGVEPMTSPTPTTHRLREDRLADDETGGGRPDRILSNAPRAEDGFFVVPRVVE